MGIGDIVSAARYNTIQGRIAALLGPGSGDRGYNNSVSSFPVPVAAEVTAAHMNNLKTDYTAIYVHLFGSLPGGLIGENVSTRVKTGETGLIWDDLYTEYEANIVTLENNRFLIDADYAAVESSGINSTRSTVWGGTALPQSVTHEFTATFSTANARRGFFNAGGEIRFSATLTHSLGPTDPDYQKTVDWASMLAAMRTVKFLYTSTDSFNLRIPVIEISFDANTSINVSTNVFNIPSHGFADKKIVVYNNNGNPNITGLTNSAQYYVNFIDANNFTLTADYAGTNIVDITSIGSGTHKFTDQIEPLGEDVSDDTVSGAGTGTAIGNLDLTANYQTIYTKTGSGVYTNNVYTIQAKLDNDARIRFLITFNDGDVGIGGADERVVGTLTSSVSHLRADGGIYVTNAAPAYGLISSL